MLVERILSFLLVTDTDPPFSGLGLFSIVFLPVSHGFSFLYGLNWNKKPKPVDLLTESQASYVSTYF